MALQSPHMPVLKIALMFGTSSKATASQSLSIWNI
jgi:hypothetical protein